MTIIYSKSARIPIANADGSYSVTLTKGYVAIIDPEDVDLVRVKWYAAVDRCGNAYALRIDTFKSRPGHPVTRRLHRDILSRIIGRELTTDEMVDHKNLNSVDNRRANLRLATSTQNQGNRRVSKNNKSGFKGVSKAKNKWVATITVNGRRIILGRFKTPEEAHEAYCAGAKEHFGEFARSA